MIRKTEDEDIDVYAQDRRACINVIDERGRKLASSSMYPIDFDPFGVIYMTTRLLGTVVKDYQMRKREKEDGSVVLASM